MMELGRLGVWTMTDGMTAGAAAAYAQRVEGWGYKTLWIPEGMGRNVLVHAAWLLARTSSLNVASGIANIYARDPMAMAAGRDGLNEQSGGRFLLGIGVSHVPLVSSLRGHDYGKPVATMRGYLEAMRAARYAAPAPAARSRIVLAALGPKMLALSAEVDGAHPYNVTPAHTTEARAILGPGKFLCVEQKVLLETDPTKARAAARASLSIYFGLTNYLENWRRLGFDDGDFSGGGSDRLMDAMVAWGDEAAIRERIQQHWDAGADHVCIQPIAPDGGALPDEKILALLAPNRG